MLCKLLTLLPWEGILFCKIYVKQSWNFLKILSREM